MINCSLFPSILKPLCKRNQIRKPKFWIGDRVLFQTEDDDKSSFWESGVVKGIIAPSWHWNSTNDEWLYYYEIEETSYSDDFKGAKGEGFEDQLTLVQ